MGDLVAKPFAPDIFAFELMVAYDAPKATITKLKQSQSEEELNRGEVHWKRKLLFRAAEQRGAPALLRRMIDEVGTGKNAPRFVAATDGVEFVAHDIKLDVPLDIEFDKLNDAFDFFLPLAGIERYEGVAENPADIKATGRLAKLYDAILEANADWRDPAKTHSLNLFMTRLLFCFFAEDTSIFERGLFTRMALTVSKDDGSDFAETLSKIFESLATLEAHRDALPEFARRFPYVNGGLFQQASPIPAFSRRARRLFRDCGELRWSSINPDIFGSMIQAVVDPSMRGDMGMHYTSVPNIMKALQPLFLLSLEEEFEQGRDSEAKLMRLLKRIYSIRVFDPACGSGNFLIIAYRELREIESRVFARLAEIGAASIPMTGVHLSQFHGIELADFAAETAKLSLWIAEYQINEKFKEQFGTAPAALPLRDSGHIIHGNALREDWLRACPPKADTETYVVGNPPYLGSSQQDDDQKADMDLIFQPLTKTYRNLDYVAAWYVKAADYAQSTPAQCAFVATNSICQGEQVAMLWPLVFLRNMEIGFAHQAFKWRNNAAHVAGVTCVIVGIRPKSAAKKTLYAGEHARVIRNISPYLIDMDDTIVVKEARPINGLPKMDWGNKPTDDGQLILLPEQKDELLRRYPEADKFIRRYYGTQEFIKGIERYCLWIADDEAEEAYAIPPIRERIDAVARFRAESDAESTQEYAAYPHRFRQIQNFGADAILVPIHFSEVRDYFTIGFADGDTTVISNACYAIYGASAYIMAILSTRLHAQWVSTVCGGLTTRIRYSNTMGYHTFPVPALSESQIQELEDHTWAIMAAREQFPGKTIGWLYNPQTMPKAILAAHQALDATMERICIGRQFRNDTERLEFLFKQYVALKRKRSTAANNKSKAILGAA